MRSWTQELPERLAFELAEFKRRGLDFHPDESELSRHHRLVLNGQVADEQQSVAITIVYPDTFPYLRPQVYAPELALKRHQNPFTGNLCLLDRSSREWNTTDTGAWLIAERLPLLLGLLKRGGQELHDAEAPQGEPLTSFLQTTTGAAVFIPQEALQIPEQVRSGTLQFGLGMGVPQGHALRAALLKVSAERDSAKGKAWRSPPAPEVVSTRFSQTKLSAPWIRLDELPEIRDANAIIDAVRRIDPGAADPRWVPADIGQIALLGILVPEEVRQGEIEQAWVFLVRWRPPRGISAPEQAYLLRGERLSPGSLQERTPALSGVNAKTVSLAGLGSLGATLAMELARAQIGELKLLDMDSVEAGNIVRWPFGLQAVGHAKAAYLAAQIQVDYPFTAPSAYTQLIGDAGPQRVEPSEARVLGSFLEGADLLLDGAAELGVSQLLADLASSVGIPMLSIWATEGGWGGGVAEIRPDGDGCWYCLQRHLADGSIPAPPAEPSSRVQPRGCGAPTFTATSFDMLEIVAQAMRATRRILLEPPGHSVVHICATRLPDGTETATPVWSTHALLAHPDCHCARSALAA